ncbi:hypothetical protein L1887_22762 [Cichorium endivia]|nr:hypothetical protein L1887_22762 [Cichorium endivia]
MKNAYDNLKAKYVGWDYLRNKTGNIYNSETNTFTLTNEEWEEFKKGHPKAASLKTHPLVYPELCATLFDGRSATGSYRYTPAQTTSAAGSSSCRRVPLPVLQITDNSFDNMKDDGTSNHPTDPTHEPYVDPHPSDTVDPTPEPSPNVARPSKKAKTTKTSIDHDDLARDMQKALQILIKGNDGPTIDECHEKLKILELDPSDPLFLTAFHIFSGSKNTREAWMTLPAIPDVLKGWLKLTETYSGVFK